MTSLARIPVPRGRPAPDAFARLREIAGNLWWSWNPKAIALFRYLDEPGFARVGNNPIALLKRLSERQKRGMLANRPLMDQVTHVHGELRQYLSGRTWYESSRRTPSRERIAYFCMEYGLHESLPLYAGGLGVLAADHLKSSSDLGLPLVALGVLWRHGYTRQRIDYTGRQKDEYPRLPLEELPLSEVLNGRGKPLRLIVPIGSESVFVRVWRLDVGRVPLFLLDTDLPGQPARHRALVSSLYSGDRDMRIRQEILLGIGGWRALRAMRMPVGVCHLNEGHAAFLSVERIAEQIQHTGASFERARRQIASTTVFTTHTPVPAGNEEFDPALVDAYLGTYLGRLGISRERFHDLARIRPGDDTQSFGMTPLALRTSRYANGVAALHGKVARGMWKAVYPGKRLAEVPIGHVTNGIHLRTWLHPLMGALLDRVLGSGWEAAQDRASTWEGVRAITDEQIWNVHQLLKAQLIDFCRRRLHEQCKRTGTPMGPAQLGRILDPEALTIGFARRCVTYKRTSLVFTDAARLARILNSVKRPVQLIFAGKAHPADAGGKALIEEVVRYSRQARFRNRVVFLENYDTEIGRRMVAGCDIWLNNPRRPHEASGTSGMKPALHGGLNLSILDGWWPEGYNRRNGWAIGTAKDHDGTQRADLRDARAIYELLENEIVPLYFERDGEGLPRRWIGRMKNALATIPLCFNTHRQVKEYLAKYYAPAMRNAARVRS